MRTPTIGLTEPGSCHARNGRSRSGWVVSARPRTTARPELEMDSCFQAGPKPRQSRSRPGSKPSLSSSDGTRVHSVLSPSSSTVAGTINGLVTLRHGAKLGESHLDCNDGREPHHGG